MNFNPKKERLQLHRITKETGISKGKAALELLKNKVVPTTSNEPEPKSKEAGPNEMPFCPTPIYLPLTQDGKIPTSVLSAEQHRRYVAIISNYLKPDVELRFTLNKLEIRGFDEMLTEERAFYETECLRKLNESKNPYEYLCNQARKLLKERVAKRLTCLSTEVFQQVIHGVDWPFDDPSTSGRQCKPVISSVLNEGHLPQIRLPNPRRKCQLSDRSENIKEKLFKTESTPIETDENAVEFALNNGLQLIMCASTLRSLLVMPWIYRDQNYSYKISVRQKLHNGRFCRFIVFSKPILSSALTRPALQNKYVKWMVKASLANNADVNSRKRRHSDSHPEEPVEKKTLDEGMMEDESADKSEDDAQQDVSMSDDDQNEHVHDLLGDILKGMGDVVKKPAKKVKEAEKPVENAQQDVQMQENNQERAEPSLVNDLLGDILEGMDGGSNKSTTGIAEEPKGAGFKQRYSIVDFVTEYAKKQSILIRSTNHGVDQNGEQISVTAKLEYLPAIGAEIMSDEELLWEFFTATFKNSKTAVNFRMHPQTGNVLQIQRRDKSQIYESMSEKTRRLISQRTERLSTLLDHIKELDLGEYLLVNSDERMEIFSQNVDTDAERVWTSQSIMENGAEAKLLPYKKPSEMWRGIDTHLLLVWQFVQGRIPGSLPPVRPKRTQPAANKRKPNRKT